MLFTTGYIMPAPGNPTHSSDVCVHTHKIKANKSLKRHFKICLEPNISKVIGYVGKQGKLVPKTELKQVNRKTSRNNRSHVIHRSGLSITFKNTPRIVRKTNTIRRAKRRLHN